MERGQRVLGMVLGMNRDEPAKRGHVVTLVTETSPWDSNKNTHLRQPHSLLGAVPRCLFVTLQLPRLPRCRG